MKADRNASMADGRSPRPAVRRGRAAIAAAVVLVSVLYICLVQFSDRFQAREKELLEAIQARDQARCSALLARGADVNAAVRGTRPLIHAAHTKDLALIQLLLKNGAEPDLPDNKGGSALHWAAFDGSERVVKLLLEHGADPDYDPRGTGTPLIDAAAQGKLGVVRILLERGADVNAGIESDYTALRAALDGGHHDTVRLLLSYGARSQEGE